MATRVLKWIGSNGDVLLPLSTATYNTGNLYSTKKGTWYTPITEELTIIEAGNPMGLLLAITYPATP